MLPTPWQARLTMSVIYFDTVIPASDTVSCVYLVTSEVLSGVLVIVIENLYSATQNQSAVVEFVTNTMQHEMFL